MTVIYVKSSNKMLYCIITVITQTNTSLKSIVYCTFTFWNLVYSDETTLFITSWLRCLRCTEPPHAGL